MTFPYKGCFTLRSISTVTVLSILSLTTLPCNVRTFFALIHYFAPFSLVTVLMRAIFRRTLFNSLDLLNWPVAFCILRLNCIFNRSSKSDFNCSTDFSLNSLAFIIIYPLASLQMLLESVILQQLGRKPLSQVTQTPHPFHKALFPA